MKAGWAVKTLGDVCEIVNGGTPKTGVDEYWGNEHLWITPAEMGKRLSPYVDETERKITPQGLKNSSARLLPPNSVILSSRAPIGHLVINTKPMATNQGCKGLVPSDRLSYKYLFYFLMANVDLLNDLGTGATFKELSGGKLKEVKIPLAPSTEQQRIIAILDQAFEGIAKARANAEQNLQNARALFESHLQSVFTQRGEGWIDAKLEDVVDDKCTLSYGIVQPGDEFDNGLPIIRPTDLTSKFINLNGLKRINPDLALSYSRTTLMGDELLLCVRGSTGVISIATDVLIGANVTRGIVPIRFQKNLISASFGYFMLTSGYVQEQIKSKTYGAALMQINIGDLRKIKVKYPSVKLQNELSFNLDELDKETQRLEALYQRKVACLDELKTSLLQQAFAGEL